MINLAQAKSGEIYLTKNGIEMEFIGCHSGQHKAGTCYVFSTIHSNWAMQTNINGWRLDADGQDYDARCCDIVKKKPDKYNLGGWMNIYFGGHKAWYETFDLAMINAKAFGRPLLACLNMSSYNISYQEGEGI